MPIPEKIEFKGSIAAVVFDWAGTVVDHGSWAPVLAFLDLFHSYGIDLDIQEIRCHMGMAKQEHIRQVLNLPDVSSDWKKHHGQTPTDGDVELLYGAFLRLQKEVIPQNSAIIEGVPGAIAELKMMGIRIGSTTGYPREVMDVLIERGRLEGFAPECVVTVSEVPQGRPTPWMILRNAEMLGIYPLSRIAVVDDTVTGVQAGRNAGCLTIGVSRTGNLVGLSARELAELEADDRQQRIALAEQELYEAGADIVIESVESLPLVIKKFNNNPT